MIHGDDQNRCDGTIHRDDQNSCDVMIHRGDQNNRDVMIRGAVWINIAVLLNISDKKAVQP